MSTTYHDRVAKCQRPFVVTPYGPDVRGRLLPEMPDWCVQGRRGECRLRVDHFRARKTGPCFALAVLVCAEHRLGFTLYPPGHVPYGRVAVAPLGVDGQLVLEEREHGGPVRAAWGLTLFRAAVDAAGGLAWPRTNAAAEPRRWWRTQGRHLALAARLVAVSAGVGQRQREQVAQLLGVAFLVLLGAVHNYTAGGYRARGRAIVQVLEEIELGGVLGERLLASGCAMQLWGAPRRWDPGGQAFRPSVRVLARRGDG